MKILVLSDSHASMHFMRTCVEKFHPDAIIHLGDYFSDGETLSEEYSAIPFYAVPGNCDRGRGWIREPETKLETIGGVRFLLTHGHCHHVKLTMDYLLADARAMKVEAVLFGHTHQGYCQQEEDGLWVLNPGSCGYGGGCAGLIEVADRKIISCRLFKG